jgi:hypothetical protein
MKNKCYIQSFEFCSELKKFSNIEASYQVTDEFALVTNKKYKFNYELLDFTSSYRCNREAIVKVSNIYLGQNDESTFYLSGTYELSEDDFIRNHLVFQIESIFIFYNDLLDVLNKNVILIEPSKDVDISFI